MFLDGAQLVLDHAPLPVAMAKCVREVSVSGSLMTAEKRPFQKKNVAIFRSQVTEKPVTRIALAGNGLILSGVR